MTVPPRRRAHVRSELRESLRDVGLALGDVKEALGDIEPLALVGGRGRVMDGFAVTLPGGAA